MNGIVDQLRNWFAVNDVIVQFVHGQVFLVLGVAMGLQWRQRSRLELARALPWLAGVGLLEAVATWGNSFIPVQEQVLAPATIVDLRCMQLLVYLATFLTLLGFGLRLNEPAIPRQLALYVPAALFFAVTLAILILHITGPNDRTVIASVEAGLRYTIGLPAALLVAYGLRQQAHRLVGPVDVERFVGVLRVAGVGFLLYAIAEGVLVPQAPFPPASLVNDQTLFNAIGIPIGIVRAIVGAVIALSFFRALEVFRIEADRVAQALMQQQSLSAERERISRDLHDGTIQSIYAAGLILDGVKQTLDTTAKSAGLPPEDTAAIGRAREQLDQVMAGLNRTIQDVRHYIYDLRSTVAEEDLVRGLIEIVSQFRLRTGIPTAWNAEGRPALKLSPERRQHVYQIAREALSNVARHADASQVAVELRYDACDNRSGTPCDAICLRISDNGTGDIPSTAQVGRGLRNMRERARLLGATLDIKGTAGKGTIVTLEIRDGQNQTIAGG
jgi:signal transduction histidine kinase